MRLIRRRLDERWHDPDPGAALWRQVMRTDPGHRMWIDRYIDWNVARFGQHTEPWWIRPVTSLILWADDWRATWRSRP